ncbi:MAG TPA: ATP-binding protein [Polyangiaceae bacterium]
MLLVEDDDADAALVLRELRRGGFEVTFERVETSTAFKEGLAKGGWDIVLSDYSLPHYTAMGALVDLHASAVDVPFILVSGTIGETAAVEAMKAGAQDYLLKNQLTRLCAAVLREVRESRQRAQQRKMREQLIISERMASAGTLAAGVAHEINNPLAVVIANLDYVNHTLAGLLPGAKKDGRKSDAPPSVAAIEKQLAEIDEPLRDAREAVTRIREIVRDVKLFSRPHEGDIESVDLKRVIESSIRMAWNEIRHRAQIVRDYRHLSTVEANEARLGQVLLNLVVNAVQAIPEGHAGQNRIQLSTRQLDDQHVEIEVRDSGCGIPRENLERIFDPFFTTKPVGIGTGLGLSICHRIVTDLGGEMSVESEVGKGTAFRVSLPVGRTEPQERAEASATPDPTRRGKVLIIDDEEALGRALRRTLSKQHDAVVVTSGAEALSRILGGERYDAIISDLMMPDVTGMEIFAQLSSAVPEQAERMIFLTGGAFTATARNFLDDVPNPRLEKPVEMVNLLAIISSLLV